MSLKLIKSADLAAEWDMTDAELNRHRRRHGWPCVRLGRSDVRFTEEQVAQIVAMQSQSASPVRAVPSRSGQTSRSKRGA